MKALFSEECIWLRQSLIIFCTPYLAMLGVAGSPVPSHAEQGLTYPPFRFPAELLRNPERPFVVLPNGKIFVGGERSLLPSSGLSQTLLLFNSDGTRDTTFVAPRFNDGAGPIYPQQVLPDGRILLFGNITTWNDVPLPNPSFPGLWLLPDFSPDLRAPGPSVRLFPYIDGRLLAFEGNRIRSLNTDWSPDNKFEFVTNFDISQSDVRPVVVPDGRVYLVGSLADTDLLLLNPDGSVNSLFRTGRFSQRPPYLAAQSDGKLVGSGLNLSGAGMLTYAGMPVENSALFRLNSDGTPDSSFRSGFKSRVSQVRVQSDDKIVVVTPDLLPALRGYARIFRLNPNGSFDSTWAGEISALEHSFLSSANAAAMFFDEDFGLLLATSNNYLQVSRILTETNAIPPLVTHKPVQYVEPNAKVANFDIRVSSTLWLNASVMGSPPLEFWWTRDGEVLTNQTNLYLKVILASEADSGDYVLHVRNDAGTAESLPFTANVKPLEVSYGEEVEEAFLPPGTTANLGARIGPGSTASFQWFLDGKPVSGPPGGGFSLPVGEGLGTRAVHFELTRNGVVYRSKDLRVSEIVPGQPGSVDTSFTTPMGVIRVSALAEENDGSLIVGRKGRLQRILSDGSLDPFNVPVNGYPRAILIQPDGKILVGGDFIQLGSEPVHSLARLHKDGSYDQTFMDNIATNLVGSVFTLGLQGTNIYVGGTLEQPARGLARLDISGKSDPLFSPKIGVKPMNEIETDSAVHSVTVLANGELLVVGSFNWVRGRSFNAIVKLTTDGAIAEGFASPFGTNAVLDKAIPLDQGRILVAGSIPTSTEYEFLGPMRLNADGSIDRSWTPMKLNGPVQGILKDRGGNFVMAGDFSQRLEPLMPVNPFIRLTPTGTLDTNFNRVAAPYRGLDDEWCLLESRFGQIYGGLARLHTEFSVPPVNQLRIQRFPNAHVTVAGRGEPSHEYWIETSTNLHDWRVLKAFDSYGQYVQQKLAGTNRAEFFRLRR